MRKNFFYKLCTLVVLTVFIFLLQTGIFPTINNFISKIEKSSFDLRQSIVSKYKTPNKDIVIIAIDDATYEYIMDKYGSWPISRKIWANIINSLENANPKFIIFDMLFLKSNLQDKISDSLFIESIKNNENIFLSMNFDNYSDEIRKSPIIPEKFQLNIKNGKLNDNQYVNYTNARMIMEELSKETKNLGAISIIRDSDGIIREATPIFKYKNNYYPNLSLAVGIKALNKDFINITNNNIVIDENHKIPLDETQRAILNWYGKAHSYEHIPAWEVLKAIKNNDNAYLKKNFENKIIYIGTSATSLSDIKSVPTESNLAGVELHATFLNNILDNNFIKKLDEKFNIVICIFLFAIVYYSTFKIKSVSKTIMFLIATLCVYNALATHLMHKINIWLPSALPTISAIFAFICVYCEKYLIKSKDYEKTYKLAVTDGLTQLYNHRYFQEQMIANTNNFKRYNIPFSLILIDIDFFKKFNDTYGHQSGDCVLKQVAEILKKNSRTSDIACRYGGEEMSIILTNTKESDAKITAEKICQTIRNNTFTLANNEKVQVTISVGVSSAKENLNSPQEIIEQADKCLYKAKEMGRNQVISEC